jgi:small subunit ribosomal protein S11
MISFKSVQRAICRNTFTRGFHFPPPSNSESASDPKSSTSSNPNSADKINFSLQNLFKRPESSLLKTISVVSPSLSYEPKLPSNSYIIHVQANRNNTLLTLTDGKGNPLMWSSAGLAKFKKGNRKGFEAATQATQILINKFEERFPKVQGSFAFKVKGFGAGREAAFQTIRAANWNIQSIHDCTPIPHGGCRPAGRRR